MVYNDFNAFALRIFAEVAVAEALSASTRQFLSIRQDIARHRQMHSDLPGALFGFFIFFGHNPKNHPKNHDAMIFLSVKMPL